MPTFRVKFKETAYKEVYVEAESASDAIALVEDGDFDEANELDSGNLRITDVVETD